jgi:hypothetical protein
VFREVIHRDATLAQLVERLIRNFCFVAYATDSAVGIGAGSSAYLALSALIESDFESNLAHGQMEICGAVTLTFLKRLIVEKSAFGWLRGRGFEPQTFGL